MPDQAARQEEGKDEEKRHRLSHASALPASLLGAVHDCRRFAVVPASSAR